MKEETYTFIAKIVVSRGPKYKSYRLTIPKPYAELLNLDSGDVVMITIKKINIKIPGKTRTQVKST